MPVQIRLAYTGEVQGKLVPFLARLNSPPSRGVCFLGENAQQIAADLNELNRPIHETFFVAEEDGDLIGVWGFETDAEIGRGWMFGPFIEHPDWDRVARLLWDAVLAALPQHTKELEMFLGLENDRALALAADLGFEARNDSAILQLRRTEAPSILPPEAAPVFSSEHAQAFGDLHNRLFPDTHAPPSQIIAKLSPLKRLFVETRRGELAGYLYAEARLEGGEGYIDYLGVDERFRREGVAELLIRSAIAWLFTHEEINEVNLSVLPSNDAALKLYAKLGFVKLFDARGLRRAR